MTMPRDPDRLAWAPSIPFFAVHAAALATPFLFPATPGLVALAAALYALRMFAITAGYHRYFAHRAYKTGRAFQLVLAVLGGMSAQKGALWWAAHHRDHHRFSDTEDDVHSLLRRGFWWSHVGWILSTRYDRTVVENVKDLTRYPELRWLDRWHVVPPLALGGLLYLAGGWPALGWGFMVSTVLLWHGTFFINSLCHLIGRKRYETGDESRNSFALAVVTLGEGWHNNHHFYAATANQGWFWWELDVSYYLLRALAAVGVVRDLRLPPPHIRDAHKLADGRRAGTAEGAKAPAPRPSGVARPPREAVPLREETV